ncbi:RNA polymerase sigma factor [uncultured Georgenia sp.]|uniref:RNA polymerase sigma factor n=1 Tax=uncultured Georgenia sp. TaxID=378209 RepID=UPI002610AF0E|nr:RNA polymerase sigma factor [uncultured Georgenia sp.]
MLDRAAPPGLREAVARGDAPATRQLLDRIPVDDPEVLDVLARAAADGGVGARLATELLVERLDASGVVRRFVRAALLDEAAVDDVTQDALISVAGSVHSFAGEAKVTTWVHRIVRHRVVDHLRRQRATSPLPPDDLAPAERMSSLIATRATLRDVLAGLPDRYRGPVTLRDVEGLPYTEVAERLGRSVGTVKSQVARGRALVAAALRSTGRQEGTRAG